jgi:hypothetical protein
MVIHNDRWKCLHGTKQTLQICRKAQDNDQDILKGNNYNVSSSIRLLLGWIITTYNYGNTFLKLKYSGTKMTAFTCIYPHFKCFSIDGDALG